MIYLKINLLKLNLGLKKLLNEVLKDIKNQGGKIKRNQQLKKQRGKIKEINGK